jgi:hypothetical protein
MPRKKRLLSRELLTSEDLQSALKKVHTEDIDVPEWGCSVRIKVLNGKERVHYDTFLTAAADDNPDDQLGLMTKLLSVAIVDQDGKSVFDEDELGELNANVLRSLTLHALRINKLTADSVKELEKNS